MMDTPSVLMALLAGVLSFLSPCILPVAPGYLSVISGTSLAGLREDSGVRPKVMQATLAFILGFTLVFILLGVSSTMVGQLLRSQRVLLARVGGVLVIGLGLHQAGWLPIRWLYYEKKLAVTPRVGLVGAFITGFTFAFGWTPCVGPILSAILALAGSKAEMTAGVVLLIVYSCGLALPFFLLALAFEQVSQRLNRLKPYLRYFEWAAGILLIAMGLLLVTGNFNVLLGWVMRWTGGWNLEDFLKIRINK
jgi:cytochrome c-type biogenesis protein